MATCADTYESEAGQDQMAHAPGRPASAHDGEGHAICQAELTAERLVAYPLAHHDEA
jgi:hypothetical protein